MHLQRLMCQRFFSAHSLIRGIVRYVRRLERRRGRSHLQNSTNMLSEIDSGLKLIADSTALFLSQVISDTDSTLYFTRDVFGPVSHGMCIQTTSRYSVDAEMRRLCTTVTLARICSTSRHVEFNVVSSNFVQEIHIGYSEYP